MTPHLTIGGESVTYPEYLQLLRELVYEGTLQENPSELRQLCREQFQAMIETLHHEDVLGTLCDECEGPYEILPALLEMLRTVSYQGASYVQITQNPPSHIWDSDEDPWWESKKSQSLIEEIMELLNMEAPPFFYFGSHPEKENSYGFYYAEESDPNGFYEVKNLDDNKESS